jgi:Cu(I)/Ag(I) efflux system membrane fusion protein
LLLLGMTEDQVQAVDREGKPVTRVTLASPADGVVGELAVREGMNVAAGAMLFRINGLATVWVNLDVPEAMAAAVRPGAPLEATVPAYPGEVFKGSVAAVLPDVNAATRTLRARAQLDNRGAKLKPGMFASVRIDDFRPGGNPAAQTVLVPSEAVIVTGERSVVIVDRGNGRFEPVHVKIGAEEGGKTEVLEGLSGGEKVVASGQFLIDSEASLRGVERRMEGARAPRRRRRRRSAPRERQGGARGGRHGHDLPRAGREPQVAGDDDGIQGRARGGEGPEGRRDDPLRVRPDVRRGSSR